MSLSPTQLERYRRQLLLKEIGGQGQSALLKAKILVIGAGGLGCPILVNLVAAGVGTITIIDPDEVQLSNLQRQFLFTAADIGTNKALAAKNRLKLLNPEIALKAMPVSLSAENAPSLFAEHDLVIEGVDRYATRYLINEEAIATGTPWISSAVGRFTGHVAAFNNTHKETPCYQCFVPSAPEDGAQCEALGVLGATCSIVGGQTALEAIKIITNSPPLLFGHLLIMETLTGVTRKTTLRHDPVCPNHGAL